AGDPTTGRIWSVRIRRHHKPGDLRELWDSGPVEGPDGFAVSRSGNVYVALTVDNGSPVPFDNPSSAWFDGRNLMVANQSYIQGDAANQAILNVHVGER